jgi:AcrR family transcriptional regulator
MFRDGNDMQENTGTKELIYTCARNLFYQDGFSKTTIKAIAEKAGVNSALISYYFGNKTNLAAAINNEYFAASKKAVRDCVLSIDPAADLFLQSAVDIRITTRCFSESAPLLRFYLELNETNYYTNSQIVSLDIFEKLNDEYSLNRSLDSIRAAAIGTYAVGFGLTASRFNGMIHCTDEYIIRSIIDYHGLSMGFPEEQTMRVIEQSVPIADQINILVNDDFTVTCSCAGSPVSN